MFLPVNGRIRPNYSEIVVEHEVLNGRRIVDISYLFKSISSVCHTPFDCSFKNLIFSHEIQIIYSEPPILNEKLTVNAAAVTAMLNTGQDHSQLDQFSAILNMPCMSNKTYQKENEFVANKTQLTTWESIEEAGKEEARLAIENGEVNNNGVLLITVVADGAWSKRSYKHNYNALSGIVCIVGYRTKNCTNHVLRNYFNRIVNIASRRKSSSGNVVSGELRTKERRLKLSLVMNTFILYSQYVLYTGAELQNAIRYRSKLDVSLNYKITLLREDIENGPYHVFGSHDKCAQYFCSEPKPKEKNLISEMEKCGLWQEILGVRNLVAHHSDSLINFVNNNCVESYNSVVAKYVGVKRINYSFRARCNTTVNAFNLGPSYISHFHKKATSHSPGLFTKNILKRYKKRKTILNEEIKKNIFPHGPDKDYGAVEHPAEIFDMSIEEYAIKKSEFLKKLKLTNEEIKQLERITVNQSQSDEWQRQKKMRLTVSNFGKVARLRSTTSREIL
ncbi:hypothetical protein QTP88_021124 [Uroleucon formosanum]